jgi:hypothetical protein
MAVADASGQLLCITGGPEVASPQTIAMVRATARMAESELARLVAVERMRAVSVPILRPDMATPGRGQLRLEALGRPDYAATLNGRAFRLSPRHSEIAVILSEHQDGLTVLSSRLYRLTGDIESDWSAVSAQLPAGDVRAALHVYRGPLLPQSDAPGVVAHREQLERQLRAAVLASGQPGRSDHRDTTGIRSAPRATHRVATAWRMASRIAADPRARTPLPPHPVQRHGRTHP